MRPGELIWTWYSISASLIASRQSRICPALCQVNNNRPLPRLAIWKGTGVFLLPSLQSFDDRSPIYLMAISNWYFMPIPAIPNTLDLSSRYPTNDRAGSYDLDFSSYQGSLDLRSVTDHPETFRRFIPVDVMYRLSFKRTKAAKWRLYLFSNRCFYSSCSLPRARDANKHSVSQQNACYEAPSNGAGSTSWTIKLFLLFRVYDTDNMREFGKGSSVLASPNYGRYELTGYVLDCHIDSSFLARSKKTSEFQKSRMAIPIWMCSPWGLKVGDHFLDEVGFADQARMFHFLGKRLHRSDSA